MSYMLFLSGVLAGCVFMALPIAGAQGVPGSKDVGNVLSADGVEIVYTVRGQGTPELIFIHGGFADRSFWENQVNYFGAKCKVIAIDLAGHGESGKNRKKWDMVSFARDVCAVMEKEKVSDAVLIGNSLGGAVVLEAARLLPAKVSCIVGVDTFQGFASEGAVEYYKQQAKAYKEDFSGTMRKMVKVLFHADVDPALYAQVEKKMLAGGSVEMAVSMMENFVDYNLVDTFKKVPHPVRCINGDLFPTQIEENRKLHPDFDAVILPHTGHYPMLEKPEEFNRQLETIVKGCKKE